MVTVHEDLAPARTCRVYDPYHPVYVLNEILYIYTCDVYVCIYIHTCIHKYTYSCTYTHTQRERERERERDLGRNIIHVEGGVGEGVREAVGRRQPRAVDYVRYAVCYQQLLVLGY